ncbi:type II toxin-antitoxin system RelE/ParE family toxin [Pseudoxanthomonas mexicana]
MAPEDDEGACEVLDQLKALAADKKTKATAAGLLAQWEQVPAEGPRKLGTDIYHRIDDENQIYEFIKRDHRLVCFEADGRIVVCSHLFRKKSQKTPNAEKRKATDLRARYHEAVRHGNVEIVDDEDDEDAVIE